MPSSTQAILNSAWIHTFAFAEGPNSRAPIHVFWTLLQKKRNKITGRGRGDRYSRLPEKEADWGLAVFEGTFFCANLKLSYVIQTNSLVSDAVLTAVQVLWLSSPETHKRGHKKW